MSDPKPLRFSRIEQEGATPDWVEAAERATGMEVSPLELPQVVVESIENAGDTGQNPGPVDLSAMQWMPGVANVNAGERAGEGNGGKLSPADIAESLVPPPPEPEPAPPAIDPELEAQLRHSVDQFVAAASELAVARHEAVTGVESELLDLAVRIAEAIVGKEIEDDSELHMALAREAVAAIEDTTRADLLVGEAAYQVLNEHFGADEFEMEGVTVHLLKQSGLSELGCIVDGGASKIDGRVSQRLQSIRRAFEEERLKRQAEEA